VGGVRQPGGVESDDLRPECGRERFAHVPARESQGTTAVVEIRIEALAPHQDHDVGCLRQVLHGHAAERVAGTSPGSSTVSLNGVTDRAIDA